MPPVTQTQSEMPGRTEPVSRSGRRSTEHEPLPGDSSYQRSVSQDRVPQDPMTDLSLTQAAEMLANRRNPAPQPSDELPPATDSDQPLDEEESEQLDANGEVDDLDPEDETLDDPDSEEEEQPEAEEETSEQPDKIVINGQEMTLAEVEDGFMRQDDYTRKTQQLAARTQEIDRREEFYATRLGQIDGMLRHEVAQYEQINWAELAQRDLQQHAVMQARYQEAARRYNSHQAQVQDFFTQVEERKKATHQQKVSAATEELRRAFKGNWNNARYYDLVDFMVSSYGVTRDDALQYTDPLLFRMAADAKAFRNAKRVTPKSKVQRTGKRVPSSRRPTTEARQSQQPGAKRSVSKSMTNLQQQGTLDAAAQAYAARRQAQRRR